MISANYPAALLYLGQAYVERGEYKQAKGVLLRLKELWKQADTTYVLAEELNCLLALVEG